MDLTQQSKQHVEQVARDALDQFVKVATAAQTAIRNAPNLGWTCDSALPSKISTLRPMFVANW